MNEETKAAITAAVMAEVEKLKDYQLELVYVDYRDGLSEEDVALLARGDWEGLDSSMDEWVSEAQWEGARGVLEGVLDDLDDWDEGVLQEWLHSEAGYEAYSDIIERDTSTPLRDLAWHSGNVLLRVTAIDEDDAWSFEPIEPTELLDRLGLAHSEKNLALADAIIAECSPEYSVCMGYWLLAVNIIDLYDLPAEGQVRATNPHFWLGNPFSGSGYADGPFEGEITLNREDLRTDKDAFGYGWQAVSGCIVSYYESKIEAVKEDA